MKCPKCGKHIRMQNVYDEMNEQLAKKGYCCDCGADIWFEERDQ